MSRSAAATVGTVPPKSSSTVVMTAWATSKVASGAETVLWLFDPALADVSAILVWDASPVEDDTEPPSVPAFLEERDALRVDVFSELMIWARPDGLVGLTAGVRPRSLSELAFTPEGNGRFIATCTTARTASASRTLPHAI